MKPEQLKEFAMKMESWCDGAKFGCNQALQWVSGELARESAKPGADEVAPVESKSGSN